MIVGVDTTMVEALAADFALSVSRADAIAADAVDEAAEEALDVMRDEVPVLTGQLQESLAKEQISPTAYRVGALSGPALKYAAYVEYGTSKMAPQPYVGPAVNAAEETLVAELVDRAAEDLA